MPPSWTTSSAVMIWPCTLPVLVISSLRRHLDLAVEAASHRDILGRQIGLDLGAALDKDILARLDRAAGVALNAHAALRAIAAIEEVVWADHALGGWLQAHGGGLVAGRGGGGPRQRDARHRGGRADRRAGYQHDGLGRGDDRRRVRGGRDLLAGAGTAALRTGRSRGGCAGAGMALACQTGSAGGGSTTGSRRRGGSIGGRSGRRSRSISASDPGCVAGGRSAGRIGIAASKHSAPPGVLYWRAGARLRFL